MKARERINLDGWWNYELFSGSTHLSGRINVPFPVESRKSFVEYKGRIDKLIYTREVELDDADGQRTVIHFGAVDHDASVFVNGILAGSHSGGYTPFDIDITDYIVNGCNLLRVEVFDDTDASNQARGKQCVDDEPHGCFYTRATGIWQSVWIERKSMIYIEKVRVNSFNSDGNAVFSLRLSRRPDNLTLSVSVNDELKLCMNVDARDLSFSIHVDDPVLWSVAKPALYHYEVSLSSGDIAEGRFGFRDISWDKYGFYLNEERTPLCLVMDQGYYPDGIYTPDSADAFRDDIIRAQKLGFNGARLHQKVFQEEYLSIADELGFLVFCEFPSWGLDASSPATENIMEREWTETMELYYSHPSVIAYCPFNETPVNQDAGLVERVYRLTKSFDPTRPVIDTSGFHHVVSDIFDIHDYEQDGRVLEEHYRRDYGVLGYDEYNSSYDGMTPLMLSEFGGTYYSTSLFPDELFPGQDDAWKKWKPVKNESEFVSRVISLIRALKNCPFIGFCYTQLYDVEQEINGLFTYDRKKKFSDESYEMIRKAIEEYKEEKGR